MTTGIPLIVVDASVAVKWVVPEVESELSDTILGRADLIAPDLLLIEVANTLRRKVADGVVSATQARDGLAFVDESLTIQMVSADDVARALQLAMQMRHPVYDCVYLAVAERSGGKLATYDQELMKRSRKAGLTQLIAELPLP